MTLRAAVFDAYGTLFDVHAPAARHADALGDAWRPFTETWRAKQLEATWIRATARPMRHRDLWSLTEESLDYALAVHAPQAPKSLRAALLEAWHTAQAFPEVGAVLADLRARGLTLAILSNGTPAMLAEACANAGLTDTFAALLSVESVGVFKPDPKVYAMAATHLRLPKTAIAFVSSNQWDARAAANFGFAAHWVNRNGMPEEYRDFGAVAILSDLSDLPARLAG